MKRASILAFVLLGFALFAVNYALSDPNGKTGVTLKSTTTGCSCHCSVKNTATTVTISSADTSFEVGKTYTFTISVTNSAEAKAGCDIAVKRGTLAAGTDGLKKLGSELTHKSPKALPATWTFTYTAPATAGGDTIYATGNAVNGDGGENNGNCTDKWNHAPNFVINVKAGPAKTLAISKTTIDLGKVRVGTQASDTLSLRSTGEAPITITSSQMKKATFFYSKPASTSRTLAVGASEIDTIIFAPTNPISSVDTFVVITDATVPSDVQKIVVVRAEGVKANFNGKSTLNFGGVIVDSSKEVMYFFSNSGSDTLFLNPPSIQGTDFSIVQGPGSLILLPGQKDSVLIRFLPKEGVGYDGTLSFSALNGVEGADVTLHGTGLVPNLDVPPEVYVGRVRINDSATTIFYIQNHGGVDLVVTSMSIASTQQGAKFSVSSSGPFPLTFSPDSIEAITVTYKPDSIHNDTATFVIESNDPDHPTTDVMFTGEGITNESVKTNANGQVLTLDVFPNPTQNSLRIRIPSDKDITGHFEIFDASAKLVMHTGDGRLSSASEDEINVNALANGEYYLRLVSEGQRVAETKFIVAR